MIDAVPSRRAARASIVIQDIQYKQCIKCTVVRTVIRVNMKPPEIDSHPSYVCSYSSTDTVCRSQLMIHIVYILTSSWVLEVEICV